MTPKELEALRVPVVAHEPDAYFASLTRCRMERASPPQERFIQELVQAWKALRKVLGVR
jgi:hypothetical protein